MPAPRNPIGLTGLCAGATIVAMATPVAAQAAGHTLRLGSRGRDVRTLQHWLTQVGIPTSADGVFGAGTRRSVIAFERAARLRPANGVATHFVITRLSGWRRAHRIVGAPFAGADRATTTATVPGARAQLVNGLAQAPAGAPAAVRGAIAAANRIATTPYVYGGGHGSFNSSGYDCSGSVSYALHGGGLLRSPEDSSELESYGASGPGRWITIWANAGHAYMEIAGLFYDTSAQRSHGGDRWSATPVNSPGGYVVRHPAGY